MTGTVQSKKGRPNYYIVLDYVDAMGKRKRPWITTVIPIKGNNKRLALAKLKEVLAEYESQQIDIGKDVVFLDFMKQWLETILRSNAIQRTTYDAYKIVLDVHIIPYFNDHNLANLKVRDIKPSHIQQYVNFKLETLSPNTVRKHIANISSCFESALRQNIIAFNPTKRIETIRKVKYTGAKILNEEQIGNLLSCSKNDPLEIVILLTLFYGLRRSEVLGLRWRAIDFDNNLMAINHTVVKVNKTIHLKDTAKNDSSYTVVPLPNIIKLELERWKSKQDDHKKLQPNDYINNGYVCTMANGNLIKPDYVSRRFKKILSKNGIPSVRFHDLRHSSASYLKYLGFDLKDIQTWIRHADIQTTLNLYTHLDMEAKWGIAEKLNQSFTNLGS